MHDHRAPGGIATLPVLDDQSVGQHNARVTTGSRHDRRLHRQHGAQFVRLRSSDVSAAFGALPQGA